MIQRVGTEAPQEKKNYPTPALSRDRVVRRNFKCRSVSELPTNRELLHSWHKGISG